MMDQWISVKDKLPEAKQKVLFVARTYNIYSYLNGEVMAGRFEGIEEGFNGKYAMFSTPGLGIEGTHWMPSPKPPVVPVEGGGEGC